MMSYTNSGTIIGDQACEWPAHKPCVSPQKRRTLYGQFKFLTDTFSTLVPGEDVVNAKSSHKSLKCWTASGGKVVVLEC